MRIVVATNGGGLEDNISPVFGRCPAFAIIDAEGNEIKNVEVAPNPSAGAVHGAGVQAAQFVLSRGANVAISGNFGPNVSSILQQAGVKMIITQGNVGEVVRRYLQGENVAMAPQTPPPGTPHEVHTSSYGGREEKVSKDDIEMLEEEIRKIEDMLEDIKKRLSEIK
jgi:predicted Fe-Mo cluster-binding NifX family protein